MTTPDTRGDWFTSSYSGNGADCVEVRHDVEVTLVRDSKNRPGDTLTFTTHAWSAFLAATTT